MLNMADTRREDTATIEDESAFATEFASCIDIEEDEAWKKLEHQLEKYDLKLREERGIPDRTTKDLFALNSYSSSKDPDSIIFEDFMIEYNSVNLEELDINEFAERCFSLLKSLSESCLSTDRQLAVHKLLPYLRLVDTNEEKIDKALPIFCKLSEDTALSVRCDFIELIPDLVSFCKENQPFTNNVVKQQLVPYGLKLFSDSELGVRKIGHATLSILMENNLIDNSQLSEWVCPLIAQCILASENSIEIQKEDLTFMNKISPLIGKDLAVKFFLDPFVSMCAKADEEIRKICASNLVMYVHFVGQELSDSPLLLSFINLCNDESDNVLKSCAGAFMEVAKLVNMKVRKEILTNIFIHLLKNENCEINGIACQELGNFISTFATSSDSSLHSLEEMETHPEFLDNNEQMSAYERLEMSSDNLFSTGDNSNQNLDNSVRFETLNPNLDSPLRKSENFTVISNRETMDSLSNKGQGVLQNELINCKLKDLYENLQTNLNFIETKSSTDNFAEVEDFPNFTSIPHLEKNSIPVNNLNTYNNFQFWKFPLPEIELEAKAHLENGDFSSNTSVSLLSIDHPFYSVPIENTRKESFRCEDSVSEVNLKKLIKSRNRGYLKRTAGKEQSQMKAESQDIVPPVLLKMYFEFASKDNELIEYDKYCACNFPAIAYTIGNKHWHILRDLFEQLAGSFKICIRKTMAASLHELFVLLNQNVESVHLLPYFKRYLIDDADEVCNKVIEHLSVILRYGGHGARNTFSSTVKFFAVESFRNWRFKFTLTEQLSSVIELFDAVEVRTIFLPFALDLLGNKIAVIRQAAGELLAIIIRHLLTNQKTSDSVKTTLCILVADYKNAEKWNYRQLYVHFCEQLAIKQSLPMDMYLENVIPHLLALAWDSVPNVRLSVARCLARSVVPLGYISSTECAHDSLLKQAFLSLRSDVERDVRHFAVLIPEATMDPENEKTEHGLEVK